MASHITADDGTRDMPIYYRLEPDWYRLFVIERAGELLAEYDARGNFSEESKKDGDGLFTSHTEAARDAGFSERQQ